jgi:hypothetical protein
VDQGSWNRTHSRRTGTKSQREKRTLETFSPSFQESEKYKHRHFEVKITNIWEGVWCIEEFSIYASDPFTKEGEVLGWG